MPERHVAAFDFDGTLTRRDTLVPFLVEVVGRRRFSRAVSAAGPAHWRGRNAFKAAVLRRALAGTPVERFVALGADYGRRLPSRLRPEMVDRLRWHQAESHEVVLVSASLHVYLDIVADQLGLDGVCAVEMEVGDDGRLTGAVVGPNCRGTEKVNRLEAWLGDRPADRLWAYGNSSGDRALLAAAHEPTWVGRRATSGASGSRRRGGSSRR